MNSDQIYVSLTDMSTKCFILVLLGTTLFACSTDDETTNEPDPDPALIPRGTVVTSETIYSESLGGTQHYAIYLPPGYDTASTDFPVLYLLHGMWGNYLDWSSHGMATVTDNALYWETAVPMIIAMPDGLDAFYCNNYDHGSMLYEDYFIGEFIPHIESSYRVRSAGNHRAIAGLSMGGYGTTFHAFKRPEMFCFAYAMSGAFYMGDAAPDLEALLTSKTEEELAQLPPFTMECGTEDYLVYQSNVDFDAFLRGLGVTHEFIVRSGTHDWIFWIACLPRTLSAVSEAFIF